MILAGSRTLSQWLHPGDSLIAPDAILEGDPLDRAVFFALILVGIWILHRRHLSLRLLALRNRWIICYFLFGLLSILWSEYPFVALKRLIKSSGNLIMALVILTEERPSEALETLLRRLSILLVPLSILLIKYYPDLGRAYHMGNVLMRGVALQKNGLGQLCLITGIYFGWKLLVQPYKGSARRRQMGRMIVEMVIIPMTLWLLVTSQSATSLLCLSLATLFFLYIRVSHRQLEKKYIIAGMFIAMALGALAIGIGLGRAIVVNYLGRSTDLTGRTQIWSDLLAMVRNPILGTGYESFWLGPRLELIASVYQIKQAHNGYLETYLNLGAIGLALLLVSLVSGLIKAAHQAGRDSAFAFLRIALIIVITAYSWTEAVLYGVNNLWLLCFIGIIDISVVQQSEGVAAETGNAAVARVGEASDAKWMI